MMRRDLRAPQCAWILPMLLAMGCAGPVYAQQQPAGPSINDSSAPSSTPAAAPSGYDEIVVTGIRADLEKALEVKKNSAVILDSIDSTELGRFPDADVADSLEHLPGITITRTTGGEGQKVSVRGLGS